MKKPTTINIIDRLPTIERNATSRMCLAVPTAVRPYVFVQMMVDAMLSREDIYPGECVILEFHPDVVPNMMRFRVKHNGRTYKKAPHVKTTSKTCGARH